ncbi:hypothetical protein C8R44DRAFT_852484 [Mycena epipterygia]|nr:hypothetical protein C8R44DRAFT_852484 [Mycena epipterygia]
MSAVIFRGRISTHLVDEQVKARGLPPNVPAPVLAGLILGAVACILLACLLWLFLRRRDARHANELALDLRTHPFPLSAKPGRSAAQLPPPAMTRISSPVALLRTSSSGHGHDDTPGHGHGRARRKAPAPPSRKAAKVDKPERRRRSSISKSILGLRWHLPPVSEGYGVGLMTRDVSADLGQPSAPVSSGKSGRRRRSSISKSILDLRWHLPPVSEGYGVGLMTRDVSADLGQPSAPVSSGKSGRRRRSSISKSILGLHWRLPPVSEGYGVGLMTRDVSADLGRPSASASYQ